MFPSSYLVCTRVTCPFHVLFPSSSSLSSSSSSSYSSCLAVFLPNLGWWSCPRRYAKTQRHVILMGCMEAEPLEHFLDEFFHPNHVSIHNSIRGYDVVLLTTEDPPEETVQVRARAHKPGLAILHSSPPHTHNLPYITINLEGRERMYFSLCNTCKYEVSTKEVRSRTK